MRFIKRLLVALTIPFRAALNGWPVVFPFPTLHGWKIKINGISIPIITTNISILEYYRHYIPQQGDLVYDIGGELGLETRQFSLLVGCKGKVVTFECLPTHVNSLKKFAREVSNVEVVDVACWNKKESLTFYIGRTQGSSSAVSDARGQINQILRDESLEPIIVSANTLDSLYSNITPNTIINYLKMDIEGAEIEALEGAKEMLKHVKHLTIAAYHIRDGKPTAAAVFDSLESMNFDCKVGDNLHVYGKNKLLS